MRPPHVTPARLAVVLGAMVAVLAIVYAGPQAGGEGLDAEGNLPTYLSAIVLALGGVLAIAVFRAGVLGRVGGVAALVFGLQLLFLSLDELLQIHERIERHLGIDWQVIYLPVMLVAAIAGAVIAWQLRDRPAVVAMLIAGACGWAGAQLFEMLQWGPGDVLVSPWMIYPEELLEISGSCLFALALLMTLSAPRAEVSAVPAAL